MKILFVALNMLLTGVAFAFPSAAQADGMPPVVINELIWMGSSASSNDEWIELRNTTSSPIDLTNWRITKLSNGVEVPMLTIPSGTIPAGGFFVIANDPASTSRLAVDPQFVDASMSLVNSKLQVSLYDAAGVLIDRADDGIGSPLAGDYQSNMTWKSMERNPSGFDGTQQGSWHTASSSVGFDDALKELGTPGAANSNQAPIITANIPAEGVVGERVYFDASETADPEGDTLSFTWVFGDGAEADGLTADHVYQSAGSFRVAVTASDGTASAFFESVIVLSKTAMPVPPVSQPAQNSPSSGGSAVSGQSSKAVRLNEVLANPKGHDADGEFIEFANTGSASVDLFGWSVVVGAHRFVVPARLVLAPNAFLALSSSETHLTLKNSGKVEVFLVDPNGTIINGVAYRNAPEGKSFSRTDKNDWKWTAPTPGAENRFAASVAPKSAKTTEASVRTVPLSGIKTLPRLTDVQIHGTVTVPPGVLSASFFYLEDGAFGVQVFSSKGGFPDLAVGDAVDVRGAVGEANGERKINIRDAEDVVVTDSVEAPDPVSYSATLNSGLLVVVDGTVTAKPSSAVEVETSEGTVRVSFARSANIDRSRLTVGDHVRIVGLWRATKDGAKLYPRDDDDIESLGSAKGATTAPSAIIPTASAESVNVAPIPEQPSTISPFVTFLVPVLFLAAFFGYRWWKKRMPA